MANEAKPVALTVEERRTVVRALEMMNASAERAAKASVAPNVKRAHEEYATELAALSQKISQGALV